MLINTVGSSDDPITLKAFSSSSGIFVIYIMEYGSEIVGEISQAARGAWVSEVKRQRQRHRHRHRQWWSVVATVAGAVCELYVARGRW